MLDITKCLYDAISRVEKASQQGSAIAAAVEGVERQRGGNIGWLTVISVPTFYVLLVRELMYCFYLCVVHLYILQRPWLNSEIVFISLTA